MLVIRKTPQGKEFCELNRERAGSMPNLGIERRRITRVELMTATTNQTERYLPFKVPKMSSSNDQKLHVSPQSRFGCAFPLTKQNIPLV